MWPPAPIDFTEPADETTPSQTPSQTPSDSPEPDAQTDATDDDSPDEEPTGLKVEIVALGWECKDVSFKASVLDEAFNCSKNGEYIGLSHFHDLAKMTDYAINVSAYAHCKAVSSADEAYWATRDKWLLEIDLPTSTVDPLLSQREFKLERTDC